MSPAMGDADKINGNSMKRIAPVAAPKDLLPIAVEIENVRSGDIPESPKPYRQAATKDNMAPEATLNISSAEPWQINAIQMLMRAPK